MLAKDQESADMSGSQAYDSLNPDCSEFLFCCLEISRLAKQIDIDINPVSDEGLPYFSKLNPEARNQALNNIRIYHDICKMAVDNGASLADSKSLVWYAIQAFGLRPTSDLFNYINDTHVIEIHDQQGIQIFRNFQFYKYCTYSLEELYTIPWPQLFKHQDDFFPKVVQLIGLLLSGQVNNVIPANIGSYLIEEICSSGLSKIKSTLEFGAPLFDSNGKPKATIGLEKGELLHQLSSKIHKPEITLQP